MLESTYRELSDGDVAFLTAMLQAGEPCTVKDISERMGKSNAYASTYKTRLLRQGVIGEHGRNAYGFELPGFAEYLRDELAL